MVEDLDEYDDLMAELGEKGGRMFAFTKEEDEQLCHCWINNSEDSVVGTSQKGYTFRSKVLNSYFPTLLSNFLCCALKNRWCRIQKDVKFFAGMFFTPTQYMVTQCVVLTTFFYRFTPSL